MTNCSARNTYLFNAFTKWVYFFCSSFVNRGYTFCQASFNSSIFESTKYSQLLPHEASLPGVTRQETWEGWLEGGHQESPGKRCPGLHATNPMPCGLVALWFGSSLKKSDPFPGWLSFLDQHRNGMFFSLEYGVLAQCKQAMIEVELVTTCVCFFSPSRLGCLAEMINHFFSGTGSKCQSNRQWIPPVMIVDLDRFGRQYPGDTDDKQEFLGMTFGLLSPWS